MSQPFQPLLTSLWIGLALAAFALMTSKRRYPTLHYMAGLGALNALVFAFVLAFFNSGQASFSAGSLAFIITALFMSLQAAAGLTMLLARRTTLRLLPFHSTASRVLMILVVVLGLIAIFERLVLLGIITPRTIMILAGVTVLAALLLWRLVFPHKDHWRHINRLTKDFARLHLRPDNETIPIERNSSILEASLAADIPHTHICGGNARCSTCRVVVFEGLENCQPRNVREQTLANKLHFTPEIRLACQTLVNGDVHVRRLVLDDDDIALTSQLQEGAAPRAVGEEKQLAVLFADIRGFTTFAEKLLPYDVIHALNRYYQKMGRAIHSHDGVINNYMGDGLLAIFGMDDNRAAALQAVQAGLDMLAALEALKPYFRATYRESFEIGIGIHYGEVIIGSMGAIDQKRETAIGDTVNLASRIEAATKEAGAQLLISEPVYRQVEEHIQVGKTFTMPVKGKQGEFLFLEVTGLR